MRASQFFRQHVRATWFCPDSVTQSGVFPPATVSAGALDRCPGDMPPASAQKIIRQKTMAARNWLVALTLASVSDEADIALRELLARMVRRHPRPSISDGP